MTPTGPRYPTAAVDGGGGGNAWSTPTNVGASDGVYSTAAFPVGGASSNILYATGFGFAIPSYALIKGIYVEFERLGSNAQTSGLGMLKSSLAVGTVHIGTDIWPASEDWIGYGGPTDLWGTTWTPAEINNSGFGVSISAFNTHGGGSASIDAIRITVYWQAAPANVQKRYLYKVFNSTGQYIGLLPNVTSDFSYSQDINTAGSQITIDCALSIDTSRLPNDVLTDEAGNTLTDESSASLTTEGSTPITAPGTFTTNALIKNGNNIQVYEISRWNPAGKCVFLGQINRWEASFGDSGGSGGAASGAGGDTIHILCYSDGQDLDNYIVRGNPYTYTLDQSATTGTATLTSQTASIGAAHDWFGQTWTVGTGVTNLGAINLLLNGVANVTVNVYDTPALTTLMGTTTQLVNIPGVSFVETQFAFATTIAVIATHTYFFTVQVDAGQSIAISAASSSSYANGQTYESNYGGGGGGAFASVPGYDLWFKTFSGTGSTTATFTSTDPSAMATAFMSDYIARGGLISYNSGTIQATGLSLTYTLNTRTILEGIQGIQSISPNGYYWYVDVGADILYFKQTSAAAEILLTKGRHLEAVTIIATVENVKNTAYFSGADVSGANIYVTVANQDSITLYGPRLDRPSDAGVSDTTTARQVAAADVAASKDEQYQTTVTILDGTMDTTLLHVGMVIGLNGFGTFVDSLLMQIVRMDYSPEEVTLTLGALPRRLHLAFEQVVRSLVALQTVANPSTPS